MRSKKYGPNRDNIKRTTKNRCTHDMNNNVHNMKSLPSYINYEDNKN